VGERAGEGEPLRLEVEEGEVGLRLDAFLARRGQAPSVAAARRLLAAGGVRVNGRPARKGDHLLRGAVVELRLAAAPAAGVVPTAGAPLAVLYEDEHLVAVDKPAGVPSHPLGAGETGTLASALVARFPECAAASPDVREGGLAHRLDVGTSGVLIAARSRAVWSGLRRALGAEGGSEKRYLAEVVGSPGAPEGEDAREPLVVEAPLGRVGRRAGRVRVGAGRGLLAARTEVRVLERRGDTSLVEARLSAGRPHQVRAHLAHLGAPVLGDATYGDARARQLAEARAVVGFRLHAAAVRFVHPVTGRPLEVEAPPPPWARPAR
jgi:23S rRNA pseudouridine1911/1915/1917 synthase